MRRLGITFVEILVVVGILMLVAGILIVVMPSAKVSANVTACKANLRQIDMAMQMYMADHDGYRKVHPNVDYPADGLRNPLNWTTYMNSDDLRYCPATPDCAKSKLFSTYIVSLLPTEDSSLYNVAVPQMNNWFGADDSIYPLIHCQVHDEIYYYPRERHLAEEYNPPFIVWMTKDGAIKSGRFPLHRGHDIARACGMAQQ